MISASDRLHLLLHLLHLLAPGLLQEVDEEPLEVITDSSPCSATCGLGVRTQTLCRLRDSEAAVEERKGSDGGAEVRRCRFPACLESWQCGLRTRTVAAGQTLELDCLGEVMEAMGRVSWRYARGVVSSDDSLFGPHPFSGTYRCDVQDAAFRRVKRVYWGVRVLPAGVLDLDYDRSLSRWNQANVSDSPFHPHNSPSHPHSSLKMAELRNRSLQCESFTYVCSEKQSESRVHEGKGSEGCDWS
uniref:Transmembrane protein 81 n=1 Tax=Salarias fasciatus TaxID=181472 RepID=A0A672HVT4_SALFA